MENKSLNQKDKSLYEIIEALYLELGRANLRIHEIHKIFFPDNESMIAKEFASLREEIPDESMIAKEFASLREDFNNCAQLQEALQASIAEKENLRAEKEHLESLVSFRDYENIKMKQEIKKLTRWMNKLDNYFTLMLNSKSWKLGNMVVKTVKKLVFKKNGNDIEVKVKKVLNDFKEWDNNKQV